MRLFNHVDNDDIVFLYRSRFSYNSHCRRIIELLDREPAPRVPALPRGRARGRGGRAPGPKPQPALYWSKLFKLVPLLLDRMQIRKVGNPERDLRQERQAENAGLLLGLVIQRSATHTHLIRSVFENVNRIVDITLGRGSNPFHNITFDTGMKGSSERSDSLFC